MDIRCFVKTVVWAAILPMSLVVHSALADVAGGQDHPEIGRFEGSVMTHYKMDDFGEYVVATGPGKSRSLTKSEPIEGKKIRHQLSIGRTAFDCRGFQKL